MKKTLLLAFCLYTSPPVFATDLPDWVMVPEYAGGIAAAECVDSSGSLSIDRQQAVAMARVALGQQIEMRVKSVDKLYTERTSGGNSSSQTKTVFQRASEQLSDRVLNNSRIVKTELVKSLLKSDQLCVMVAMPSEATREYFREMVKVANVDVPAKLEDELFESFRDQSLVKNKP